MRRLRARPSLSAIAQDGRVVGALHDEASRPFRLDIDANDHCGHDRPVGGELWLVRLRSASPESNATVELRSSDGCPGQAEENVGVCDNGDGTYVARFETDAPGVYDVELALEGAEEGATIVARVEIVS